MSQQHSRTRKLQPEYQSRRTGGIAVPCLHLSGVWLEKRGFRVGQTVEIIERDGLLVIQPLRDQSAELHAQTEELRNLKQTLKQLV